MVLNCTGNCLQITYPFHQTDISWLFCNFSICFISLYIISMKAVWFILWIYSFERKKHYHLHLQPRQYMSISPHLHLYANYPSFGRFCWRQKCCLWFLRCLPFFSPYLFRLSRFFKLHSQTFHSSVLMQEEKCCSWIKSRNTLQYHITWSFWCLLFFHCLQNNQDVSPICTYN